MFENMIKFGGIIHGLASPEGHTVSLKWSFAHFKENMSNHYCSRCSTCKPRQCPDLIIFVVLHYVMCSRYHHQQTNWLKVNCRFPLLRLQDIKDKVFVCIFVYWIQPARMLHQNPWAFSLRVATTRVVDRSVQCHSVFPVVVQFIEALILVDYYYGTVASTGYNFLRGRLPVSDVCVFNQQYPRHIPRHPSPRPGSWFWFEQAQARPGASCFSVG